ncbi:MAG: D-glycero-beta-D-manno-heptose 1,7-bisphosphate 7-phosphatase [Campylobacterota bacterium]|nr:D-glycero-beta-D-manno-heptose 1,7-bisphosphate 7-phosphatase [Campylobacterota bacterium]
MEFSKPALFLDRDGVINIEKNYLHKIEDVEFVAGIFELCRYYQELGYLIIVVTNQSGIARGMYGEKDFEILSNWMIEQFKKERIEITCIFHCPHHPDFSGDCECRKPKPKMLLDAQKSYDIDMQKSMMIGDSERDIEAAIRAGVGQTVLLTQKSDISSQADHIVQELRCLF